ncbi:hypothetical protein HK405_001971, partial [Cladochytrium tenue]
AILKNPATYEILRPEDFGLTRHVAFAHRLTGWNAIKSRADELAVGLSDDQIKAVTHQIKLLADAKPLDVEDVDTLLRQAAGDPSKSPTPDCEPAESPRSADFVMNDL